jgi:hypothetical protein
LFERTFTPEERARIQADARKMLQEDDRRAAPASSVPQEDGPAGAAATSRLTGALNAKGGE